MGGVLEAGTPRSRKPSAGPNASTGRVGVVPAVSVDDRKTDDPRLDDGTTEDTVATTGPVTCCTTVVIGRTATGTAAAVIESTVLVVPATFVRSAAAGLTTAVAVVATVAVETDGAAGGGREDASAAPANRANQPPGKLTQVAPGTRRELATTGSASADLSPGLEQVQAGGRYHGGHGAAWRRRLSVRWACGTTHTRGPLRRRSRKPCARP
jgi:hypothetical protein